MFVTSGMQPDRVADYLMRQLAELHTHYRRGDELIRWLHTAGFHEISTRQDDVGLADARRRAQAERRRSRPTVSASVIYEAHLRATEENAWPLDTTIAWDAIDLDVARTERELHQALHDAALIEGYLPMYAARLMQLLWDDVDATAVLSMELYEGLKHFTALTRYLDRVGFQREDVSERSTRRRTRASARHQIRRRRPDRTPHELHVLGAVRRVFLPADLSQNERAGVARLC